MTRSTLDLSNAEIQIARLQDLFGGGGGGLALFATERACEKCVCVCVYVCERERERASELACREGKITNPQDESREQTPLMTMNLEMKNSWIRKLLTFLVCVLGGFPHSREFSSPAIFITFNFSERGIS